MRSKIDKNIHKGNESPDRNVDKIPSEYDTTKCIENQTTNLPCKHVSFSDKLEILSYMPFSFEIRKTHPRSSKPIPQHRRIRWGRYVFKGAIELWDVREDMEEFSFEVIEDREWFYDVIDES